MGKLYGSALNGEQVGTLTRQRSDSLTSRAWVSVPIVSFADESPFPPSSSSKRCNTGDNLKRHGRTCKGTPPEQSTNAPARVTQRGQVQLGTSQPPSPAPAMPDPSYGTYRGATPHPAQPVLLHDWSSRPSTSSSGYHNTVQHDAVLAHTYPTIEQQRITAFLNGQLIVPTLVQTQPFQPGVITPDSYPYPQAGNSNASYYGNGNGNGSGASVYSFGSTRAQRYPTTHDNGPNAGQSFISEPYYNDMFNHSIPE
jgi:hypothetical protein